MRTIIIKEPQAISKVDVSREDFISFNYEGSFLRLLLLINLISAFILYLFIS